MRKFNVFLLSLVWVTAAIAEDLDVIEDTSQTRDPTLSYTTYGTPGLVEMPTAQSAPDAELALSGSYINKKIQRYTLTFQILPRLSGSFRYSRIDDWKGLGRHTYDRSFDMRYRFLDEGRYMPAMAIGLQDFVGTSFLSGEYIVATKHITPKLSFTGGVGWGRYGSYKGTKNPFRIFGNRFERRPVGFSGRGGQFEVKKWFRGDMGFFGGIAWSPIQGLVLKAEYSSDKYELEGIRQTRFNHKSPFNFGIDYEITKGINLQGHYLYGNYFGATLTFTLNPKAPPSGGYRAAAPAPVKPRNPAKLNDMDWVQNPERVAELKARLAKVLKVEGIILEAADFDARIVTVRIRNRRYVVETQVIGRTARIMTQLMPDSVSTFRIVPVSEGMALSAISLNRGDLETLENAPNGAAEIYARAQMSDFPIAPTYDSLNPEVYPKFNWSVGPDVSFSYFDPNKPFRYQTYVKANAQYNILPGLSLEGSVNQPLFGTQDNAHFSRRSRLPHVRTDVSRYDRVNGPRIGELTAAYYFRPGTNLYGRFTGGLLEQMFGGVSAELLWSPVDKPYALGAELDYAWKRGFRQRFGFRKYNVPIGHVSGYYELPYGFDAQLDLGRYLAKDWGGTLSVNREFVNGWKVGAFATITDATGKKFGEGSFDKGINLTIPLTQILGKPTRRAYKTTIRPIQRDGGAQLRVSGRLYNKVRKYHRESLKDGQGRFWR